jgi:hypothetical protein
MSGKIPLSGLMSAQKFVELKYCSSNKTIMFADRIEAGKKLVEKFSPIAGKELIKIWCNKFGLSDKTKRKPCYSY